MAGDEHLSQLIRKNEIIGLIFRLTLLGSLTYFGIKWMVDTLDPTRKQKLEAQKRAENLMKRIGVKNVKLSEYELSIAANLVDPLSMSISWRDIGGLDSIIQEIQETVILPFQRSDLFHGSSLLQPPKGVLLHGPPGCGKTMIAKALAKEAGARFINLQFSALTDKWYGESQKLAAAVFSLAIKLQPAIIFIDEIDSFLRSRDAHDHEATAMMKAQFMSLWDGLITDTECRVIIMGATNRPQDVDKAILRRMPSMFHIGSPNIIQRESILSIILDKECVEKDMNLSSIAKITDGFSGSDLKELCRTAAVYIVRDYMRQEQNHKGDSGAEKSDEFSGSLRPITMDDLLQAVEKVKESKVAAGSLPSRIELD